MQRTMHFFSATKRAPTVIRKIGLEPYERPPSGRRKLPQCLRLKSQSGKQWP